MKVRFDYFPGGKKKALTMSYDDGRTEDRRLTELFRKYGIKGSFHLNSGKFDSDKYITAEEVKEIYQGHEVSCHMLTHPFVSRIPTEEILYEISEDKKNLENLCGYIVRGMSYPYGDNTDEAINALKLGGMKYSRTTVSTNGFGIPSDFMRWNPTCHHKVDIFALWEKFKKTPHALQLFYIWGHSYEFPQVEGAWERMEEFCKLASGDPEVWYATNIEIYDYITALHQLEFSADKSLVYNPSATTVWIAVNDKPVVVEAGKTTRLA